MIELSAAQGGLAKVGVAGDTLNTAIYLKRNAPEIEVDYITRLGDDPFSDQIRAAINDENIGTSRIETETNGTPGLYAITTADDGERSFTYWRSASAARDMFQSETGSDFSALEGYDMIYLSGISLAILPNHMRHDLLTHLVRSGQPIAFDSNYRPKLWESREAAQSVCSAFFAAAKVALPSIDDEMELWGETKDAALHRLANLPGVGAIKKGSTGPLSIGVPVTQTYTKAPKVIDTTAAGDSFNGGFLAAYLSGKDHVACLLSGHNCAKEVVQHAGAILPRS